ncbi:MAG: rhodanese-like domain-containing protein [Chloroflexi bacterium]|nr:rhodanese-like domain-containing protein [Chloroflexota bacterium]
MLDGLVGESLLVRREKFSCWLDGRLVAWMVSRMPAAVWIEIAHVKRAREAVADGVIVLDMREPNEYEAGHVEGAIHVPLGSLEEGLDGLRKDRRVLAHCGHGEPASTAFYILERAGGGPLMNLSGGMGAWEEVNIKS